MLLLQAGEHTAGNNALTAFKEKKSQFLECVKKVKKSPGTLFKNFFYLYWVINSLCASSYVLYNFVHVSHVYRAHPLHNIYSYGITIFVNKKW